MMARIYPSQEKAEAAADALVAAGFSGDDIEVLNAPGAAPAPAPSTVEAADTQPEGEGGATAATPETPETSMATAIRVGSMLGRHADFYMAKLEPGNSLLVTTPPFMETGAAERILDAHDPLPVSHVPPAKPYEPVSAKAAPLSDLLGLPVLSRQAPIFSEFWALDTKSEGTTHLSRWFPALADNWTMSGKLGMGTSTKSDTPLSSMLNLPTRSKRLEGKSSSFGLPLTTRSATPLSSMLGLRTIAKRDHYLYS